MKQRSNSGGSCREVETHIYKLKNTKIYLVHTYCGKEIFYENFASLMSNQHYRSTHTYHVKEIETHIQV